MELYIFWIERINVSGRDHLLLNNDAEKNGAGKNEAGPSSKKLKPEKKKRKRTRRNKKNESMVPHPNTLCS